MSFVNSLQFLYSTPLQVILTIFFLWEYLQYSVLIGKVISYLIMHEIYSYTIYDWCKI